MVQSKQVFFKKEVGVYGMQEQRREAREAVRHRGMFEGESPMVPILYDIILNGFDDGMAVDGEESYTRVGRWILWESSQGFVHGVRYPTREQAADMLEGIMDEIEMECDATENLWMAIQ